MCHCIGQNSYMGHSSPSPLWISDDQAGTGRAVQSGPVGIPEGYLMKGQASRLLETLDNALVGYLLDVEHALIWFCGFPLVGSSFPSLKVLQHPCSSCTMDIKWFKFADRETLSSGFCPKEKSDQSHRGAMQEARVLTSDTAALYSASASLSSHWLSLQCLIHKELHCFIAGRCEEDMIVLSQVTVIFAARSYIALLKYCMGTAGQLEIYSVKSQTPFYAVVWFPRLQLHFSIACLSKFNSRWGLQGPERQPPHSPCKQRPARLAQRQASWEDYMPPGVDRLNVASLTEHNDAPTSEQR